MRPARRCLSMVKGDHRYVFQYEEGAEATLLGSLVDSANDAHSEFDWFDAAVLSYQLGHGLCRKLEPIAHVELG